MNDREKIDDIYYFTYIKSSKPATTENLKEKISNFLKEPKIPCHTQMYYLKEFQELNIDIYLIHE